MASLQRVLVSVGSAQDASLAVARAARIAGASGAAVRLVRCVYDAQAAGERYRGSPELDESRAALVAAGRAGLDDLARPLAAGGLEVSTAARWAYPLYEGLVTEASEFAADLIVTASSRSPASRATALTQTDWELIRHSPCPLLLTRSGAGTVYRDILVAVDPMHEHDRPAALDDELIGLAGGLAGACGARLSLLHCYLPPQYLPFRAPGAVAGISRDGRLTRLEAHQEALRDLAARCGVPESSVLLEPADPRDGIPEAARRLAADLVVMGVVARSRLRRFLIGSTAEPVLDQLGCDVLVVKPPAVG